MSVASLVQLLDPPLWLVTAGHAGQTGGLIATNVTTASIVPDLPRFVVGLARQHRTWSLVDASGTLALHLFSTERIDWVARFGLATGRDTDKFAGLTWSPGLTGSPIVEGAIGWLEGRVEARFETGDRTLFLVEIVASGGPMVGKPLTVQTLLRLASADQRAELERLLMRDAEIDAAAIRTWRGQQ